MSERYDALTVRESNGKSFWTRIGVAFPAKQGGGFSILLDAMPASQDGQYKILLRVPQERDGQRSGGAPQTKGRPSFDDDLNDDVPFISADIALEARVR